MPVRARFVPDEGGIKGLFSTNGQVGQFVTKATRRILARAKVNCPVDTGRLRNSGTSRITVANGKRVSAEVSFNANYAAAVHNGTRPHVIRPRRAKVLAFRVGSKRVFATKVNHPGTKARPFLADALKQVAAGEGFAVDTEQ